MAGHDVVVIGFSAGGLDPIQRLVADLPSDLPAAVLVVHHFPPTGVSALASILRRVSHLEIGTAEDGEPIRPGRIFVGPPDRHLLVSRRRIQLTRGPRENGYRPAIDPLFRTAARHHGARAIGVLLSGMLDDGMLGLHAIKSVNGIGVVQDPATCEFPGMPASAVEHVAVDHIATPEELGPLIDRLVREPAVEVPIRVPRAEEIGPDDPEPAIAGTARLRQRPDRSPPPGRPAGLTCPDCGGQLWESEVGETLHYRCHVGHAHSPASLYVSQSSVLEGALWSAVRALEEKAELARRLAERGQVHGLQRSAAQFGAAAHEAEHGSAVIRQLLLRGPVPEDADTDAESLPRKVERS